MNEVKTPEKEEYYLNFVQDIARSKRNLRYLYRGGFMNESNPPVTSLVGLFFGYAVHIFDFNATHCLC